MTKQPDNQPSAETRDAFDPPANDENGDLWLTDEDAVERLNIRWRKVIEALMDGDRIYEAYAKAYDINVETPSQYNVAKVNGSRLLTNANFRRLWDKVLAEHGFNDQAMDMQLMHIIRDPGTPSKERINGIKHFNELRGRVIKKVDHTNKGERFDNPFGSLTADQLRALAEAQTSDRTSADPA